MNRMSNHSQYKLKKSRGSLYFSNFHNLLQQELPSSQVLCFQSSHHLDKNIILNLFFACFHELVAYTRGQQPPSSKLQVMVGCYYNSNNNNNDWQQFVTH